MNAFSALTLLVGCHKEHSACKIPVPLIATYPRTGGCRVYTGERRFTCNTVAEISA